MNNLTDDRARVKAGDRVRVTMEGGVTHILDDDGWSIILDGGSVRSIFEASELAHATITILEPKIKVGDWVTMTNGYRGRVVYVAGDYACVDSEAAVAANRGDPGFRLWTMPVADLIRIEPQS